MTIKINDLIINALILLYKRKGIRSVSGKAINKYGMEVLKYLVERDLENYLEISAEDWEMIKISKKMPYYVIVENGRTQIMMKENYDSEDLVKLKRSFSLDEMIAFNNEEALKALGITRIKNEEKVLDESEFLELFLALLASNKTVYDLNKHEWVTKAHLVDNYLKIIEIIIKHNSDWIEEYSSLINVKKYFSDSNQFEIDFEQALCRYIYNKEDKVNFELYQKQKSIEFDKEEIVDTVTRYDKETIEKMKNFISLFNSIVYQEEKREEIININNRIIQRYSFQPLPNKQKVKGIH